MGYIGKFDGLVRTYRIKGNPPGFWEIKLAIRIPRQSMRNNLVTPVRVAGLRIFQYRRGRIALPSFRRSCLSRRDSM